PGSPWHFPGPHLDWKGGRWPAGVFPLAPTRANRMSAPDSPPWEPPAHVPADPFALLSLLLAADDRERAAGRSVLTAGGLALVRRLLLTGGAGAAGPGPVRPPLPRWDAGGGRLWLRDRVPKAFRQPAPPQMRVSAAF